MLKLQSPSPGCPGPLWTGGDVVGSPSTSSSSSPSLSLGSYPPTPCPRVLLWGFLGGPKLGVSASICGLPILSLVLPGTAQGTHCSALVPRGTRAAHPASSTSFLAFTFSGAASVRDP